ncbi:hypothetical protein [Brevibacillus porteri]|uniref:hypothetical protein n=1 Tax=Brevibacillus porteri TaxID=2126350 RepID=UPI003639EAA4
MKTQTCMCGQEMELHFINIDTVDDYYGFYCYSCGKYLECQYHGEWDTLLNIKEVTAKRYAVTVYYVESGRNLVYNRNVHAEDIKTVEWILNQLYDVRTIDYKDEWAKEEKSDWDWDEICKALNESESAA